MGYLKKQDVLDAIHEDLGSTLMCYEDNASRDIVQFCYECIEREIDRLPQYRVDNVAETN